MVLRCVGAPGREGNLHIEPGLLGRLLDRSAAAEDDQIGERDFLAVRLRPVEVLLDILQTLQHFGQFLRIVDVPILLRDEPDACAVSAAALVGAAERGS